MMTPTLDDIFRTNVAWAKTGMTKERLERYREVFLADGVPVSPTALETAAIELLRL